MIDKQLSSQLDFSIIVMLSRNLERLSFINPKDGNILGEVENPLMTIEPQAILLLPKADEILARVKMPHIIEWNGLWIYNDFTCAPPSIGSFKLLNQVISYLEMESISFTSILDIGCGSGILGIALMKMFGNIKLCHFADINPAATERAKVNCTLNDLSLAKTAFYLSDGFNALPKGIQYDILISNPPMMPRFQVGNFGQNSTGAYHSDKDYYYLSNNWQDSGVLKTLIIEGATLANLIFLRYSELMATEVKKWLEARALEQKILTIGYTPMTIPKILQNSDYLESLKERGLRYEEDKPYPFWHRVYYIKLYKKTKLQ